MSSKLILVTGANGFIAAHALNALLDQGYRVRGTVRSEGSAERVRKAHGKHLENLSLAIVPDMTVGGAFDEAVKGVHGVLHIASPFTRTVENIEKELLNPAIKGAENILDSVAAHAPEVKRVVITSSFAAMADFTKGVWPGHTYTEADWNDIPYEYAATADPITAYCASKSLAEKAAWKYIEDRKPHFSISVMCPPMVFGPAAHDFSFGSMNIATGDINSFFDGSIKDVPPTFFWGFVDVRDLAAAHVRALEVPEAANERFFITGGRFSYQLFADTLRKSTRIPATEKKNIPVGKPGEGYPGPDVYEVDSSKSKRILGIEYRTFEESIVDAAVNILELRKTAEF